MGKKSKRRFAKKYEPKPLPEPKVEAQPPRHPCDIKNKGCTGVGAILPPGSGLWICKVCIISSDYDA